MKMFIDKNGFRVAELGRENQVLADFLMGDVQGSLYGIQELINACTLVERREVPKWEGTGNAHTVIISRDSVEIFNEYTEGSLSISDVKEFKMYLNKWKEFISSAA